MDPIVRSPFGVSGSAFAPRRGFRVRAFWFVGPGGKIRTSLDVGVGLFLDSEFGGGMLAGESRFCIPVGMRNSKLFRC